MWTSSSSSSSTTTSSSSSSPYAAAVRRPRTMEEVWKDITLAASDLHLHPSPRGVILQDFFSRDPPTSSVPSVPSPPLPPPTMLTLSSGADRFGQLLFPPHHHLQPISPHHASAAAAAAFDAVVPDGGGKKRLPDFDRSSGDRRHKRMIKNRESAARSRARKQAYTNELELEVANLMEENARLRKEQEMSNKEAVAEKQKKKKPLHRSSTAPF